jgi:hypothetical protein
MNLIFASLQKYRVLLLLLFGILLYTGCAYQPRPEPYNPPGFSSGLFHGFIVLFSLIGSIFMNIRIYAFPNSGFFYDLGFLLGLLPY